MHKRIKRIALIVILLLLAALFIFPRMYLNDVCDEMLLLSSAARSAVLQNEVPTTELARMSSKFADVSSKLRLFLGHASVDALGVAITSCEPLTDADSLLSGLNQVEAAVEHLVGVESLSPDNIF